MAKLRKIFISAKFLPDRGYKKRSTHHVLGRHSFMFREGRNHRASPCSIEGYLGSETFVRMRFNWFQNLSTAGMFMASLGE